MPFDSNGGLLSCRDQFSICVFLVWSMLEFAAAAADTLPSLNSNMIKLKEK